MLVEILFRIAISKILGENMPLCGIYVPLIFVNLFLYKYNLNEILLSHLQYNDAAAIRRH